MSGHTTTTHDRLIRSELWSSQLKDVLEDELMGMRYVRILNEFPDGDTFTIPSIGQAQVDDYVEGESVKYHALDTGEFQFQIDTYLQSGTFITDKMKQDSFYMSDLVSSFVPKQNRAIMTRLETDIMALGNQQVAGDTNTINGAAHRMTGSDIATLASNEPILDVSDFAKALYALQKANVPTTDLVAIVDPSVEYHINTITNITNVSNNPKWEGIISDGIATGMRFIKNIYGFDVFVSNYLASVTNETPDSQAIVDGKVCMFFSAAADVLPFVGAFRQLPTVESQRNMDLQRDEFLTTARYGVKLFRPENLVTVLTTPQII